jgi:Flp pilus assembly protein TadD
VPTARAYEIDCRIKSFRAKHKAALAACRNAVDLAPDDPEVRHAMALALINAGDPEAALDHVAAARAAAPEMEAYHGLYEGTAEFFAGRSESALEALRRAMAARPDLWSFDTLETGVLCSPCIMIVAALGDLGRTEKAQERVEQFMSYHIDWSVQNELYFRPLKREQDVEHLRESLRAAGVPSQ